MTQFGDAYTLFSNFRRVSVLSSCGNGSLITYVNQTWVVSAKREKGREHTRTKKKAIGCLRRWLG